MFSMNGITPESLVEPIDFGVGEESVANPFEAETLKAEVVSRATQGFEKGMKYLLDNPKIVGLFLAVGIGSYLWGKRN